MKLLSLLILVSVTTTLAIDFSSDCRCNAVRSAIVDGNPIAVYQHAWHTILNSAKIPLEEKRSIREQALVLAQHTHTQYIHKLGALSNDPHYATMFAHAMRLAISGYLISSAIAFHLYNIHLKDPRSQFFFTVPKLVERIKKLEPLAGLVGFIQIALGDSIAPLVILWTFKELSLGPADIRAIQQKINNLQDIIRYTQLLSI